MGAAQFLHETWTQLYENVETTVNYSHLYEQTNFSVCQLQANAAAAVAKAVKCPEERSLPEVDSADVSSIPSRGIRWLKNVAVTNLILLLGIPLFCAGAQNKFWQDCHLG